MLIVGDDPGDGLEKPVAFPSPEEAGEILGEGLPLLNLMLLIEPKLARGMTAKHRLQELADAIQLIRANKLLKGYADHLAPYVRNKFLEIWDAAQIEEDY